jgi:hypothetical protein
MNQRTASAPYWSTIGSGSTVFFFDFDIFSMRPISADRPRPSSAPIDHRA